MRIFGNHVPDEEINDAIALVGEVEAQEIHSADHWREEIKSRAAGNVAHSGDCLPWTKSHDKFRLRPGELTVWGGYDGHMKSLILGQIMAHLAYQGRKCAIASLEMKPAATLLRMCRQVTGCHPSSQAVDSFLDYAKDYVLIYDQLDMVEEGKILGFLHYVSSKLGCHHVVLDSLTKLAFSDSDYTAEIKFINRLQFFAKALNVHVHLICHCRKPQSGDETHVPTKTSIRGPSQITNLADNVVLTWTNHAKHEAWKKREAGLALSEDEEKLMDMACQKLFIAKQREGEWQGIVNLWLDRQSLQFLGNESHQIFSYRTRAAA